MSLNYQIWENIAIIFGCPAASVAKPQSVIQYSLQLLRKYYETYSHQFLNLYGLKEWLITGETTKTRHWGLGLATKIENI